MMIQGFDQIHFVDPVDQASRVREATRNAPK